VKLRIVAGSLGGRFIEAPAGRGTRPTAERVREAWFAAIGDEVAGADVLDLFAGSGALGIEALSRGADRVHFVESDGRAMATLRKNLANLGIEDRATTSRRDVFRFLDDEEGRRWDLALADPPYDRPAADRLRERFLTAPFADVLWLEHADARPELRADAAWTRRYGDTRLSRFDAPAGTPPTTPTPEAS
jgi:16S rRNA (guanine966-N2)-methyltransferase